MFQAICALLLIVWQIHKAVNLTLIEVLCIFSITQENQLCFQTVHPFTKTFGWSGNKIHRNLEGLQELKLLTCKPYLMVSYKACLKHVHCIFLVYFQQLANSRWSHSGLRRPIPLIGKRAPLPDPTLVGKTTLNHPMVLKRSSSDNELFMRTMRAFEPGTKINARFIVQSSNSSSVLGIVWVLTSLLPKQLSVYCIIISL